MEIGEKAVDDAKAKARCDEERCFGFTRRESTVVAHGRFERAQRGRAYCNDAAAAASHALDCVDGFNGDSIPLAVHAMSGKIFVVHRLESAGADVQGQIRRGYAALIELREHRLVEMQPRS